MDSLPQELDPIDGQKPSDYCAVVGYMGKEPAYPNIVASLRTLQHRGQESAGIATYNGSVIRIKKGMGLVPEVFNDKDENNGKVLSGYIGIGHTRYSTAGNKNLENAGPFLLSNALGYMSISHNGEINNAESLKEELKRKGSTFLTSSDTEVMLMVLSREIIDNGIISGFKQAMSKIKGAYSIAAMINGRLFALRDPYGFRPLILGKVNSDYIISSESCVFDVMGGEIIRDVKPGELIEITEEGPVSLFTMPAKRSAHCMFEYVYFARPDSIIDNIEVFDVRIRLGMKLAREFPAEADVVVPVPDSGRAQALGYARESGIMYTEGLIKNRYSERTFIMPDQQKRTSALKMKLNPIKSAIDGKRVVLVDDSIVRGNTMRRIISILRKSGAKEVHVRIGSPQIIAACYFGVDMKTKDQFIAEGHTLDQIRDEIGADSLGYVSVEGLVESVTMERDSLCLGCVTGEYPVELPGKKYVYQTELESY